MRPRTEKLGTTSVLYLIYIYHLQTLIFEIVLILKYIDTTQAHVLLIITKRPNWTFFVLIGLKMQLVFNEIDGLPTNI